MIVIDYALKMPEAEKKSIEINAQKRIKNLKPEIVVQQLVKYYQTVIKTF
jgi:hypothetical protein